jgi:RNA polymerase sigma factor (sigma-70 family)
MDDLIGLVTRAQACDLDAYGCLVQRFQDMAVGYAYTYLGDAHLAEDVAQEAFLEAYANLVQLRHPAAFAAWLRKIVFKHCDRLTRGKQLATVPLDAANDVAAGASDLAAPIEADELKQRVRQAIWTLPSNERTVITLFYISDYSQREISAFLDLPVMTIKNRLRTARTRLRASMLALLQENLSDQRPSRDITFKEATMEALDNLIQAACSGDVEQVRRLLQADPAQVHTRDPYLQSTPLHYAAHRGYLEIVQLLLTAGADVMAREGSSDTIPLHWAAEGGHLEVARLLVDHGADVNAIDGWHNLSPVGWAVALGSGQCRREGARHEVADFMLSRGAQLDIFSAIAWGKPDAVRALIETDRAVLRQPLGIVDQRQQPLHFAVQQGRPDMVTLLLDAGVDVHATTAWGLTPFCLAVTHRQEQIAELLRARQGDGDLSAAVALNQLDRAKALLEADSTVVGPAGAYQRLLHCTAQQGLAEATALLLSYGADPNVVAEHFHREIICTLSPLHVAAWHGQVEVARVLLDHGADLQARDAQYESTPFIWAKWHHQEAVAALLKQRGAQT